MEHTTMAKYAFVTGTPFNGYTVVLDDFAQAFGFAGLVDVKFPRYRVAQDVANAVNADLERLNDRARKQAIRNGTLRVKP